PRRTGPSGLLRRTAVTSPQPSQPGAGSGMWPTRPERMPASPETAWPPAVQGSRGAGNCPAMASLAARHSRHQGPHLFEVPLLFKSGRKSIYEIVALVWLATEVVRFVRTRLEATSRGRVPTPVKEGFGWKRREGSRPAPRGRGGSGSPGG